MKNITILLIIISYLSPRFCNAQNEANKHFKVPQVEIRDPDNRPVKIPKLGEKHLLIFYPDPDHASQNQKFTDDLEEHQINSDNIYAFGIVNLKDAPFLPNAIIRAVIRHKVNKTGAQIFTDPEYKLRDGWQLGEVNDKFTIIFVTKEREIAFLHRGEMSQADIKYFFKVIDKYR